MGPEFQIGSYRLWFVIETCGIVCSLIVRFFILISLVTERFERKTRYVVSTGYDRDLDDRLYCDACGVGTMV